MNLSTLLRVADIRERFTAEFPKPRIIINRPILAQPRSKRYSLVGTAFDYLMRFHLSRAVPHAKARGWVAEASVGHSAISAASTSAYDIDSGVLSFPRDDGRGELGQKLVADARKAYDRFLRDGVGSPALLKGVIHLAQLDAAYRSGFVYEDENLGRAAAEDVRDLRNLISLLSLGTLSARTTDAY